MIFLGGGGGGGGGGGEVPSVSLDGTLAFASGTTGILTTNSITATPLFGTGPYTYAWTVDTFDSIAAVTSLSATTAFRRGSCVVGEQYYATAYCTVTDSLAVEGVSSVIDVVIERS